jgi:hypothetical protein
MIGGFLAGWRDWQGLPQLAMREVEATQWPEDDAIIHMAWDKACG